MNSTSNSLLIQNSAQMGRKPRIALMGEFSSGKSTLSNLLLGSKPLPEKVTATKLPPVWISHGDDTPYREGLDGEDYPVELSRIESVPLDETRCIRIFQQSEILELCDLIDMPGISDPNMSSEVWERLVDSVDAVVWCTHATQAWRQSEAAVWDTFPEALHGRSILLITRIDKILSDTDRQRVIRRVAKETQGKFANIFPVSLLHATEAAEDRDKWEESGVGSFLDRFLDLIVEMGADATIGKTTGTEELRVSAAVPRESDTKREEQQMPQDTVRVVPTRVKPASRRTERPAAASRPRGLSMVSQGAARPVGELRELRDVFATEIADDANNLDVNGADPS